MSKSLKITSIVIAALASFAALAAWLLSRVDTKSRFEAVASAATGFEVIAQGGVAIRLFPALRVTLKDVTLRNGEALIAAVGEADVGVQFWPLLRKQVRIKRLVLQSVSIAIERDRNGHLNFAKPAQVKRTVKATTLAHVSFIKTNFRYTNHQFGKELKATDCKFDSNNVQIAEGSSADIIKNLSLSAQVRCAEVRNNQFVGSDVELSVAGKQGIFKLTPVTMQMMGGKGSGTIDADFTGAVPSYQIHYSVAQLQVDKLFKSLSSKKAGEGFLDFTADLSMRGFNAREMTRTSQGEASLRGKDFTLAVGNLDEKFANYESSQNFNLIDVGAFFIAGPVGTAVTKGYNFASIFKNTAGNTDVRTLVSHWKVANGVARAQEVAMTTKENRLAMSGALDFVNREFDEVTVALLDDKGCVRVEQKISGPFAKPEVAKPNVLRSLAGPVSRLVGKAKDLVGVKCKMFIEGSVAP